MEAGMKAIPKQLLDHSHGLGLIQPAVVVGLRNDVEFVRFEPGRSVGDLAAVKHIGVGDRILQGCLRGGEPSAVYDYRQSLFRPARADSRDGELIRVTGGLRP